MSFGGLLGSLYGDLPAPKSGPLPPELADKSGSLIPRSIVTETPTTAVPEVAIAEEPVPAPSPAEVVKKQPLLHLLPLPPSTRRRHPAKLSANSQPKKPKDSGPAPSSSNTPSDTTDPTTNRLLPQVIVNEYDPARPNSYDEYVKERAKMHRRREEQRRQLEEMERMKLEQQRVMPVIQATSMAISGDEAYLRRQKLSAAMFGGNAATEDHADAGRKKQGFAEKMLQKMGWKQGEGLGREKQGIVAPLVARKTDKRSGVIVQGGQALAEPVKKNEHKEALRKDATRIVLLTNLVGRGDVDSDLEAETAEEAAKYGHLLAVKVVELPDSGEEECVRIFCEFESIDGAINAFTNFDKRLFGGRCVKAQFYSEDLYGSGQLST